MSDSRRRSSRRGKKLGLGYSANDLVQIPHNSTTVIGRLACKLTEQPSVRWLVSFDDIPSRKDEEIPEEAIGPVVGHFETIPKTSFDSISNVDTSSFVTPCTNDSTATTTNTTRSLRKKSNSGSNSSNSADDSAPKVVVKKKIGGTIVLQKGYIPKEKVILTTGVAQEMTTPSLKVNGREQRSRRRQALTHDEVSQHAVVSAAAATVSAVTNASVSLTNKRSIVQSSSNKARGDGTSRNKKAKVGVSTPPPVRGKNEVLKVQLLTGTLYLYRGAQRHVEFIPKY